jgi:pimeloyl-ACP methyl ester carboxylesterase
MTVRTTLVGVVIVFLLGGCAQTLPPSRTWDLPPDAKAVRVNGYDMAYLERGAGQPVVLVHGALSDFRYFASAMELLSQKYRVIAVSLRHHYPERWEGKGATFSLRQHTSDLVEFLRALRAGPVHLVGHSRGGSAVLYVASAHPELVRTLTVAEGGGNMPAFEAADPAATAAGQRSIQRSRESLERLEQGKVEDALAFFIDDVGGPGAWKNTPEPIRQVFRDNAWTIKGMANDKFDPYTCADAGRIKAPVLLVTGEKTLPFFVKMAGVMESCLARSQRAVVANASHGSPRQNAEGFAEAVVAFVSKH